MGEVVRRRLEAVEQVWRHWEAVAVAEEDQSLRLTRVREEVGVVAFRRQRHSRLDKMHLWVAAEEDRQISREGEVAQKKHVCPRRVAGH